MVLGICQVYLPGCSDILVRTNIPLALRGGTRTKFRLDEVDEDDQSTKVLVSYVLSTRTYLNNNNWTLRRSDSGEKVA